MGEIYPFDAGGWFPIHNHVFDVIMPSLSANGWKVLCVAIRQTWGWTADGDPANRKEWDRISYDQFQAKAGIGSRTTISRALTECIEAGYILRRQVGRHPGTGAPIFAYALNRRYKVASPENGPAASPENGPAASPENGLTKQKETNKQGDDGHIITAKLTLFGVDAHVAQKLAETCSFDQVSGWIEHASQQKSLRDPAAFVVSRLLAGLNAPEVQHQDQDRRRFSSGLCQACWQSPCVCGEVCE